MKETYDAYNLARFDQHALCDVLQRKPAHPAINIERDTVELLYKTTGEYMPYIDIPSSVHYDIIHRAATNEVKRQINKLEQKLANETLSELERNDIARAIDILKTQQQRGITPEYLQNLGNSLRDTLAQITKH